MKTRRFDAGIAVFVSLILHLFLISYGADVLLGHRHPLHPAVEPLSVWIAPLPLHAPKAVNKPVRAMNPRSSASGDALHELVLPPSRPEDVATRQPAEPMVDVSQYPASSASVPSTAVLLDQIADGVLRADKARTWPEAASKPWIAKKLPDRRGAVNEQDAMGGRIERVQTAAGTYCVRVPNAATAYRHASGFNLAVVGNCP